MTVLPGGLSTRCPESGPCAPSTASARAHLGARLLDGDPIADFSGVLVTPPDEADEEVDWALARQESEPGLQRKVMEREKLGDLTGASAMVRAKIKG